MTRITKDFFEEVYYKSIETEYTKLFENGYYNRLKECTSEDLYAVIVSLKDGICSSDNKKKNIALERVRQLVLSSGENLFQPKNNADGLLRITSFMKELDELYWKDTKKSIKGDALINCVYEILLYLKNKGDGGIPETLLSKAPIAGIENDFMSVSSSYDDALKQYITKFFEEDSRKDFSDTPKGVRKNGLYDSIRLQNKWKKSIVRFKIFKRFYKRIRIASLSNIHFDCFFYVVWKFIEIDYFIRVIACKNKFNPLQYRNFMSGVHFKCRFWI